MQIQEPDLNAEPYLSAVKNSIYSIYFRGQTPKSRHDVEVVAGNKITFENGYRDILDSSLDLKLIEYNDVAIFQWLYNTVNSDLSENFEINDFLNYQYDQCDKKDYFLILTKNLFFENFSRWRHQGGVMEMKWDKFNLIMSWFENKARELKELKVNHNLDEKAINDFSDKVSHKVLLLYELGIIDYLNAEYFGIKHTERNGTDLAELISKIIEASNVDTVRKAISGISSHGKDNIKTKPAIVKVQTFLSQFNIPLKRLKNID